MENKFNHFNEQGEAIMVDVSNKEETERIAVAKGRIKVDSLIIKNIKSQSIEKGDVLGISRVAGIMAVKKTAELIPLCHPLFISKCEIGFQLNEEENYIEVSCTVKINHKTGVEMEALMGVNVALLTIYDMCKSVNKNMEITNVHLDYKSGGKSGVFSYEG